MALYLFVIFILALVITLWSMRDFEKKQVLPDEHNKVRKGSIVILEDKVQHYQ